VGRRCAQPARDVAVGDQAPAETIGKSRELRVVAPRFQQLGLLAAGQCPRRRGSQRRAARERLDVQPRDPWCDLDVQPVRTGEVPLRRRAPRPHLPVGTRHADAHVRVAHDLERVISHIDEDLELSHARLARPHAHRFGAR
jgi:hypothetical protein